MHQNATRRPAPSIGGSAVGARLARVVAYYLLLGALVLAAGRFLGDRAPAPLRAAVDRLTGGDGLPLFDPSALARDAVTDVPAGLALAAVLAMIASLLMALPVAWVYTLTRARRGYRQSVVQSIVLLPVVVAGVVVLVKHSLALAFSLAGIVAAVRFRNTLEDSKDAVYVFLATGIGLAAGVDLGVAAALSVVFNAVIVLLWWSDLGRSTRLEGRVAEERLRRVLASAGRTGTFVAKLDSEVLREMSPEQLDALVDRAWRRRRRYAPERTGERTRWEGLVRVRTGDIDATRPDIEQVLEEHAKRWRYGGAQHEDDGVHVIEYVFQMRKGRRREALEEALRARCGERALAVEIV